MASDTKLKTSQVVSNMIKQGFISDPFLSSPSNHHLPKFAAVSPPPAYSPASSPPSTSPNQSPTLFHMMSKEQSCSFGQSPGPVPEARHRVQERISRVLAHAPFQSPSRVEGDFGDGSGSGDDVKLTIAARDGWPKVSMDVHRRVLSGRSRFFAEKLRRNGSHSVEILDCDDVEVYVETVVLMYCDDLKKKLIGEGVSKVLGLLKVSSAIVFDDGIMACLDYLEAAPWSLEEEEKVVTLLSKLHLPDSATDLLNRVVPTSSSSGADDILLRLLSGVLQAKDDKSRKEMKIVISRLLREEDVVHDISRDVLYNVCHGCISSLLVCVSGAISVDESGKDRGVVMGEIAREADNVQWIVDILIDRKIGDEFVDLWADQKELVSLHSKIPAMYRHEISRITAQLCVAIGRGNLLVPKETRFSLLSTWLEALYDDFGWMRRACRSIDKKVIEDGLSQTILTLPLPQQQAIMLNWFHRFLNKGDDCPNIQKAFEVWWRRAFVKQYVAESRLQIALCDYTS